MNKRQKKKRIDKIFMCRLGRYGEVASTIRIRNDILQRHSKAPENDPLRLFLNQLVEELEDTYYMSYGDYYKLRKPIIKVIKEAHERVKEEK